MRPLLGQPQQSLFKHAIGVIQLELIDWQQRPPAKAIIPIIREKAAGITGQINKS